MIKGHKYLTLFIISLVLLVYWPQVSGAQEPNQIALVLRHGENDVRTACVEFSEPQLNGYEVLQRSGLEISAEFQGNGALICGIDQTGCPASACLCQCQGGGDCTFWSYWHLQSQTWVYSPGGASGYQVQPGAVEGWSWGPGNTVDAIPPPQITFAEVCAAETMATSTPTPSATATTIVLVIPTTETAPPTSPPSTNTTTPTVLPSATPALLSSATAVPTATATPLPTQQNSAVAPTAIPATVAPTIPPTPLPTVAQLAEVVLEPTFVATQAPEFDANERVALPTIERSLPATETAVVPILPTQPAAIVIAAADSPSTQTMLRVVGAGAVATQVVVNPATAVAADDADNTLNLFPYLTFIVIIILLLLALLLVNRRHKLS